MSIQDPIADLLTRIRNGQSARKKTVKLPASKIKTAIVKVLHDEGYIANFRIITENSAKPELEVELKYYNGTAVIQRIERVSRPGLRIYKASHKLPVVLGGLGVAIISTPRGIISDKAARRAGCGGEVLCIVE